MTSAALNDAERRAWLRLARTQNVGPATFAALIGRFGSATAAIAEVPRLARRGGGETLKSPAIAMRNAKSINCANLADACSSRSRRNFHPVWRRLTFPRR